MIVKPEWQGQTVVICASGPSVTPKDIDIVSQAWSAEKCRVIAINGMYKSIRFADILYFCDFKFFKWHAIDKPDPAFYSYKGDIYTIAGKKELLPAYIHRLNIGIDYGLSRKNDTLNTGKNSGYQCINLAYLLGCTRIILVGFDMKPDEKGRTHSHDAHPVPTPLDVYGTIIKGAYFDSIAKELADEGIEVINTSMDSAIHCFNKMPLDEVLF